MPEKIYNPDDDHGYSSICETVADDPLRCKAYTIGLLKDAVDAKEKLDKLKKEYDKALFRYQYIVGAMDTLLTVGERKFSLSKDGFLIGYRGCLYELRHARTGQGIDWRVDKFSL